MANQKLSDEALILEAELQDNTRIDVTIDDGTNKTSKALEFGLIRQRYESFTNNLIGQIPIAENQIIVEIFTSDIGATPNDTFNNINTKLQVLKSVMTKNVNSYILFEPGTYDIGGNLLSFSGFLGGNLVIISSTGSPILIKGSGLTFSINNCFTNVVLDNIGIEGITTIINTNKVYISNSSFNNNVEPAYIGFDVSNSNVVATQSVFAMECNTTFSPCRFTYNSIAWFDGCTFDNNSTDTNVVNYGIKVEINSYVHSYNSILLGVITRAGVHDTRSIFSIHSMIEDFDPSGSTTPLTSTKKSDALKELDLIKLNSADLPAQVAFELAGKTSDDIAEGANHKYLTPTEKTNVSSPSGFQTLLQVNSLIDSATVGLLDDRGNYDASTNLFPSTGGSGVSGAIKKGDVWTINVAGTLGGVSVTVGDVVRALSDSPGQTSSNWSVTENNLGFIPEDSANKSTSTADSGSSTKFPVWSAIVSYFNTTKIRELFGITKNTVSTNSNATVPIKSYAIPLNTSQRIFVVVKGNSITTPANKVSFNADFACQNNGGVASIMGTFNPTKNSTFSPTSATNLTLTFSGANAILNVTGVTGQDIDWEITTLNII